MNSKLHKKLQILQTIKIRNFMNSRLKIQVKPKNLTSLLNFESFLMLVQAFFTLQMEIHFKKQAVCGDKMRQFACEPTPICNCTLEE